MRSKRFSSVKKFLSRKKRDASETEKTESSKDSNPWEVKTQKQSKVDHESFSYYVGTLGEKTGRIVERLGRTKIHVHFLLKVKRAYYGILGILHFVMALLTTFNIFLFLYSMSIAYLCLDYLWKTHRYDWRKPRDES